MSPQSFNPLDLPTKNQSLTECAPANWTIRVPSPAESERMLRDEPRYPAWEVLAEFKKKYGADPQDG
jgi:hypothetical protein